MQFTIAVHALKQLYSAYGLLYRGSYEDAIALLRSVYESFLRIIFISCNPKYAYNAYQVKGQTGPKFNATNLVDVELKLKWSNYRIMSAFTHSNKFNVIEDITEVGTKGQTKPITLRYKIDDKMISITSNYLDFFTSVFLKLFDELFTADPSKQRGQQKIREMKDLLNEYSTTAEYARKTHSSNTYWRQVAKDVGDIFELIHFMDKNTDADWRKAWKKVRGEGRRE